MSVSTIGLTRGEVLAALYNASSPQVWGHLHYDPAPMTAEQAGELLSRGDYFDYLKGRVMKVRINGDSFDEWGYDCDNGQGAAQRAISAAVVRRN